MLIAYNTNVSVQAIPPEDVEPIAGKVKKLSPQTKAARAVPMNMRGTS
jgi:hypothetical protein